MNWVLFPPPPGRTEQPTSPVEPLELEQHSGGISEAECPSGCCRRRAELEDYLDQCLRDMRADYDRKVSRHCDAVYDRMCSAVAGKISEFALDLANLVVECLEPIVERELLKGDAVRLGDALEDLIKAEGMEAVRIVSHAKFIAAWQSADSQFGADMESTVDDDVAFVEFEKARLAIRLPVRLTSILQEVCSP